MQAALKLPIANDNLPFVPQPLEVETPVATRSNANLRQRDILATLLLIWTLPLGIIAGLFPGVVPGTTVLIALMAAGLTAYASTTQSRSVLAMASAVLALTSVSIWQTGVDSVAGLVWPLALGIVWAIQAMLAAKFNSAANAALIFAVLLLSVCALTVNSLSLSGLAALGAVSSFLYLGLARAASKSRITTSETHYVGAWLTCIASAATVAVLGFTGLTPEMWVILSVLSVAALGLWAAQGLFPFSQSLCMGAIALAVAIPSLREIITLSLGGLPGLPVHVLLGAAAVTAAGAALCARGFKRDHLPTLLIGLFTAFASMMATVQSFHGSIESLAIFTLCGAIMMAWLFTARISGA